MGYFFNSVHLEFSIDPFEIIDNITFKQVRTFIETLVADFSFNLFAENLNFFVVEFVKYSQSLEAKVNAFIIVTFSEHILECIHNNFLLVCNKQQILEE